MNVCEREMPLLGEKQFLPLEHIFMSEHHIRRIKFYRQQNKEKTKVSGVKIKKMLAWLQMNSNKNRNDAFVISEHTVLTEYRPFH